MQNQLINIVHKLNLNKIRRLYLIILLLLSNILCLNSYNYDVDIDENTLQIVFFERIVRLIELPQEKNKNEFKILILNDKLFADKAREVFKSQTIKEKKVIIELMESYNEREIEKNIANANIVYLPKDFISNYSETNDISKLLKYSITHKTLTFSYKSNLLESGLMINYILKNNKIKYEVNQSAILKSEHKPSYILLNYAEKVVKNE